MGKASKAADFNAKSILRVVGVVALGILPSTQAFAQAVGQPMNWSYRLVMGSPEQCAQFLEMFSNPRLAAFEVHWVTTGRSGAARPINEGALAFESPSSGVMVRFEHRRMPNVFGQILTFSYNPRIGDPPTVSKSFRGMSECKLVETQPIEACVLDDDALAKKFKLPALNSTRVDTDHRKSQVFGNGYGFFRFKDQVWMVIGSRGWIPSPFVFGFAFAGPDEVVAEAASSLFKFGCQLEQQR